MLTIATASIQITCSRVARTRQAILREYMVMLTTSDNVTEVLEPYKLNACNVSRSATTLVRLGPICNPIIKDYHSKDI